MPTPIWSAELRGDKLILDRPAEFKAWRATQKPGRYELTLRPAVKRRGSAANRYYRGVVLPLFADACGWDRADLHYELRHKFLAQGAGEPPRSTADLSTAEFARFVDDVRRLAAEYGVAIPDPNEAEA